MKLLLFITLCASVVWRVFAVRRAPDGYEDSTGFHKRTQNKETV
jgi:hypothetical protein